MKVIDPKYNGLTTSTNYGHHGITDVIYKNLEIALPLGYDGEIKAFPKVYIPTKLLYDTSLSIETRFLYVILFDRVVLTDYTYNKCTLIEALSWDTRRPISRISKLLNELRDYGVLRFTWKSRKNNLLDNIKLDIESLFTDKEIEDKQCNVYGEHMFIGIPRAVLRDRFISNRAVVLYMILEHHTLLNDAINNDWRSRLLCASCEEEQKDPNKTGNVSWHRFAFELGASVGVTQKLYKELDNRGLIYMIFENNCFQRFESRGFFGGTWDVKQVYLDEWLKAGTPLIKYTGNEKNQKK